MDFTDKVAVITGAASGLGLGIAVDISKNNGTVILLDIDKERLEKAAKEKIKEKYETFCADVTKYDEIEKIVNTVVEKYGHIDYMFNNAGLGGTLPFEEATIAHWKKIVNLNLFGAINGVTAIYPVMKKQKSGYIINTSSIAGLIPYTGQTLYNTTKFAVTGMSLSLERELKKDNINISIICPGMVKTRIFYKPIIGNEAPEEYVKIPKEAIPVEEAVSDIMKGIGKKKKIIITPKFMKRFYLRYRLFGKY